MCVGPARLFSSVSRIYLPAVRVIAWGKKLERPAPDHNGFVRYRAAEGLAIAIEGHKAEHRTMRSRWRLRDGVFADDAVGLHLVDRFERRVHDCTLGSL